MPRISWYLTHSVNAMTPKTEWRTRWNMRGGAPASSLLVRFAASDSRVGVLPRRRCPRRHDHGYDLFSHYARKKDIERSTFDAVEITELCVVRQRPSRDFTTYPVCGTCKHILEGIPK